MKLLCFGLAWLRATGTKVENENLAEMTFFHHIAERNILGNNTDCSDALGAHNSDSFVLLTPVDRKFLL